MNRMEIGITKVLKSLPISSSIDKPNPKFCEYCGQERSMDLRDIPGVGKRWTINACVCAKKRQEEWDLEQKQREKRVRINRALKLSSVNEELRTMTFDNFKLKKGNQTAYQEVLRAIDNFDERGKIGLMIFGETGNGKSHLTAAGANELIKRGYSVIFLTEKDLFSRLKETKNFHNNESFSEIMRACLEADLLVWDDFLSSQRFSSEEKDWTFQIVNGRERANKPIWATSNLSPAEFEDKRTAYRLDDKGRTWWRLIGNMNCIHNTAGNYRALLAIARMKGESLDEE